MQTQIVLISGKQGSGKTTTADKLIAKIVAEQKPGKGVYVCGATFAQPLYEMHAYCRNLLIGAGINHLPGQKDGKLLQLLGTEWGRNTIGENVWVDVLKGRLAFMSNIKREQQMKRLIVVISDCRFVNEFDAFPEALRVRLECDAVTRKERILITPGSYWRDYDLHPSEIGLDDYTDKGMFDLTFRTASQSVNYIVNEIHAQLNKRAFPETGTENVTK